MSTTPQPKATTAKATTTATKAAASKPPAKANGMSGDWAITTIEECGSDGVSNPITVYWADEVPDGHEWMAGLEPFGDGRARLFASKAEAKAAYRAEHGTLPKTVEAVQLSEMESLIARADGDRDFDGDGNYIGPDAPGTDIAKSDKPIEPVIFDKARARAVTDGIKGSHAKTFDLLAQAWQHQVWIGLGYADWNAWIDGEFEGIPLALPRQSQAKAMKALKEAGLTTRAIAAATGTSQKTASRKTTDKEPESKDSRDEPVDVEETPLPEKTATSASMMPWLYEDLPPSKKPLPPKDEFEWDTPDLPSVTEEPVEDKETRTLREAVEYQTAKLRDIAARAKVLLGDTVDLAENWTGDSDIEKLKELSTNLGMASENIRDIFAA